MITMTTEARGFDLNGDDIEDALRYEPEACEVWRNLLWRGMSKRQRRFNRSEMLAYCRNMAEQRARQIDHGTGAT